MLILLTNYYPYYKGEEYLESEIKYFSEKFDNIIVIPTLLNTNMKLTRKVPEKVKVLPITYNNSKSDKIKSALNSILKSDKNVKSRIKDDSNSIVTSLYNHYFEGRTREVTNKIINELKQYSIDPKNTIIYSYWFHATAKIAVDLNARLFNGDVKKIIARGHRYDVDVDASPIKFLPLREYLLENIDILYCVSSKMSEKLKKEFPKYSEKITSSRLGVKKNSDKAVSNNFPFKIVSVSRIRRVKNIDKIIGNLSKLKGIDYTWYHFGSGDEFENIKSLATQKLNNKHFKFMGEVNNQDLMDWFKNENPSLFINLSSSEGIPVSIMEAMSFGIPTIATDVGGNSEIVKNSNGILVDLEDIDQVYKKIEEIYNLTDAEYEILSRNAYYTWKEEFNSDKNYEEFVENI